MFIWRSPQRREQLDGLSDENDTNLDLVQDNKTRWNSAYITVIWAISLKVPLQFFMLYNKEEKEECKRLNNDDFLGVED
jgi:hypothetical protein